MTAIALPFQSLPAALLRHWRTAAVVAAMAALWLAAAVAIVWTGLRPDLTPATPAAQARLQATAAAMSATRLKQVSVDSALAINASVPIANAANPAAAPFRLAASPADRARSLDCLTAAVYYEAATEPLDGQRAVAQVVLNRVLLRRLAEAGADARGLGARPRGR